MSERLFDALNRLAAACAADDVRALPAPWIWTDATFLWNQVLDHGVLDHGGVEWPVSLDNREVIAASRNRLGELARVLADAAKRIDLLENLAIQDGAARDQLRNQIVAAERERDQAIIDHRDALDQWEEEVNVAVADETKVLREQIAALRAVETSAKERVDRIALWEAINAYVITCGGDPGEHVYGNVARMNAVVRVEDLVSSFAVGRDALSAEVQRLIEDNARLETEAERQEMLAVEIVRLAQGNNSHFRLVGDAFAKLQTKLAAMTAARDQACVLARAGYSTGRGYGWSDDVRVDADQQISALEAVGKDPAG